MSDWLPERLPEDIDCERSFLATCCAPGAGAAAVEAIAMMEDSDFVAPQHRAVFQATRSLMNDNCEVNSLTLKSHMEAAKTLNLVGGYPGLVELLAGEDVERPAILAEILIAKGKLRKLVHIGASMVNMAASEADTPESMIDLFCGQISDMARSKHGEGPQFIADIGDRAMARIKDIAAGRFVRAVPTGFPSLDRMLGGGFKPGQLIILAARPGIGKSTMAQAWCRNTAQTFGVSAFYSLEMGGEEVWTRMAASMCGIPYNLIESGRLDPDQWRVLTDTMEEIKLMPMLIEDRGEISVPEVRAGVDKIIAKMGGLALLVVDYLQLVTSHKGSHAAKQSEAVRIGEISRQLKLMAKDRRIPAVVLSQLNREIEKRQNGRPQLSDLRDSGAVEQDADVVIFIHRKGEGVDTEYELIVAKNRNGPTGTIPIVGNLATYTFTEKVRETAPVTGWVPKPVLNL